jgi:hypothetical protein
MTQICIAILVVINFTLTIVHHKIVGQPVKVVMHIQTRTRYMQK